MIKVFMYQEKWRIQIGDEIWEFQSGEEMLKIFEQIYKIKDVHGRLKR